MLNLPTTVSQILVITSAPVNSIAVHASFIDIGPSNAVIPGALDTTILLAATTVVVPSPLPTFSRNVKFLSVTNTSGLPCGVTIQQTDGATAISLFNITLQPGYTIQYDTDGNGFRVYNAAGRILVDLPGSGGAGILAISAGTTQGTSGTIVFSNSNNVTFGMNGNIITASAGAAAGANINLSAGTTSNLASAFTFANANGVSFGLNASTITASFGGQTVSAFSQDADFVTNFTAYQAILSFQKLSLPMNLRATQLVMLADFRGTIASSDGVTLSHAVYTLSGGTASLASSGMRTISWPGAAYSNVSGTQYRTIGVNYSMTPGDYLFAWAVSTANGAIVRPFGRMAANIVGVFDGVETAAFLNGSSVSSVNAFPASIAVSDTGYARTGFSALLQPGAILLGT